MRFNVPLTLMLFVAMCGQALAAPILFRATLSGPAEEPPNASPGTGVAFVSIDPVAHTMSVDVDFQGLLADVTVSHIHVINGPGDVNLLDTVGPVATTTPTFPGFPAGVTAGSYSNVFDMLQASSYRAGWITDSGGTTATAEAALFAGIMEGRAYLNIHSTLFPAGEIRGFLQAVPEPGGLALLGLGAIALVRSRRGRRTTRD